MPAPRPTTEIHAELRTATHALHASGGRSVELAERVEGLRDELNRAEAAAEGTLVVFPGDPRLFGYRVHFVPGVQYRFWASDAAHAAEQAGDAEPFMLIDEIRLETPEEFAAAA